MSIIVESITNPVAISSVVAPVEISSIINPVAITGTLTAITNTVPVAGTLTGIANPIDVANIINPVAVTGTIASITDPVTITGTLTGITDPVTVTGLITGITNPITVDSITHPVSVSGLLTGITNPVSVTGSLTSITNPVTISGSVTSITNPVTVGSVTAPLTVASITNPVTVWSITNPINVASVVAPVTVASVTDPVVVTSVTDPVVVASVTAPVTVTGTTTANVNTDKAGYDAYGRTRVSDQTVLFSSSSEYKLDTNKWETSTADTGAVVAYATTAADACIRLTTGGDGNGARAIKQSRQFMRYQQGKSQLIMMSFRMATGTLPNNTTTRVGYFNGDSTASGNGIYLERSTDNTGVSTNRFVRKTESTGAGNPEIIAQLNWNLDKLDGSGASGVTLDLRYANSLVIDLQLMGVGRVRVGFNIKGTIIYAHQFLDANALASVYLRTGSLPIRYEVFNTAAVTNGFGPLTIDTISAIVHSEGVPDATTCIPYSVSTEMKSTAVANGTLLPILIIRAKATTSTNALANRGQTRPLTFNILNLGGSPVAYHVCLNPTFGGVAPVYSTASGSEITEYTDNLAGATTLAAVGTVLSSGYATTTVDVARGAIKQSITLVFSELGSVQDVLCIAVAGVGGAASVLCSLDYEELY